MDRAHGGLGLRADRAHGAKIVRTLKGAGRAPHQVHIEVLGIKAYPLFQEWVADVPVEYFIYIFFFYTGTDGVKILRLFAGVQNGDILRQTGIDGQRQSLHGYAGIAVKIRAVSEGVHPCVRAAAADHTKALARDFEDRVLQGLGHRHVVFLHLPAVVAAAVIAQAEGNVFHSAYRLSTNMTARNTAPRARAI